MKVKTIWKIHSILGLLAGIPLLLIAITGSILVFRTEIDALWDPAKNKLDVPASAERLPYDQLTATARESYPDQIVAGWALPRKHDCADYIFLMDPHDEEHWTMGRIDPYSGMVLAPSTEFTDTFTGWVLEFHYTFLADHVGLVVIGLIGVILCLLGVSGFFIYRKFWKSFFKMKWKTSLRLFSGNLHKRIGIVTAPFFLILGFTGAFWNIQHILGHLNEEHEEEHAHLERTPVLEVSLDEMIAKSKQEIEGFQEMYISLPHHPGDDPVYFYGYSETRSPMHSDYSCVTVFNAKTGELQSATDIRDTPAYLQAYDAFRPLHYGNFGGIPVKIIWCVLGLSPAILALSGTYIGICRLRQKKKR